jgi:hypothetical protein
MNYYEKFSPQDMKIIKDLNEKLLNEENQNNPDNNKILKLKQQILMKGIEMSAQFNTLKYNIY